MKKSLYGINSRLDTAEEKVLNLKHQERNYSNRRTEADWKSLSNLWNNTKCYSVCLNCDGADKIFEDIMAKVFKFDKKQ